MASASQVLSLQVLDAVQDLLHIDIDPNGEPFFVPDRVNTFTVARLRDALRDIYSGNFMLSAISDMESYGRSAVQTCAVGYFTDFDLMVKLGLLLGQRAVLWESLLSNLVSRPDAEAPVEALGGLACDLILMREAVKLDCAAILPHPRYWCGRYASLAAAAYTAEVPEEVANPLFGLINARALEDEGIHVHPYMYVDPRTPALHRGLIGPSSYYSEDHLKRHNDLQSLLLHKRLTYVRDVSISHFCRVRQTFSRQSLSTSIRDLFHFPDGLSPEERLEHQNEAIGRFVGRLDSMNQDLAAYERTHGWATTGKAAAAVGSSLSFVAAAIAVSGGQAASALYLALSGAGFAAIGDILPLIANPVRPAAEPTALQFFSQLEMPNDAA